MTMREGGRPQPGNPQVARRKIHALLFASLVLLGIGALLAAGCTGTPDAGNRSVTTESNAGYQQTAGTIEDRFEALNEALSTRDAPGDRPVSTTDAAGDLPSEEEPGFEATVSELISNATLSFRGAGKSMHGTDLRVYDLITDPDLADRKYLGREKGVVVTILYDPPASRTEDSLWGHEVDATRIAGTLFGSDAGRDIGMVAVLFQQQNAPDVRVKLLLTAEDAKRFGTRWDNRSYIRMLDWSEAAVPASGSVAYYEDPESALIPLQKSTISNGNSVSYGSTSFRNFLQESTATLDRKIALMEEARSENRTQDLIVASEDLVRYSLELDRDLGELPLSGDLDTVRTEYIQGISDYRNAGCSFWYASQNPGSTGIANGTEYLAQGEASVNAALKNVNLQSPASPATGAPDAGRFPDALRLNERFNYQDEQQANDISVKIQKWGVKTGYGIVEDGVPGHVEAGYGYKFLTVVVQATHLGFRGGDGSEQIVTPSADDFTLYYEEKMYTHSTPDSFMETIGEPYESRILNRKESQEGVLVFKVPASLVPENAFIEADLGSAGTVVWSLA